MKRAGVAALTAGLGSFLGKFHIPGVATKLVKVEILNPTKDAFTSEVRQAPRLQTARFR